MKPRSVTRRIFASPIFWLAFGAWIAGLLSAATGYVPGLIGSTLAGAGCAALTYSIERWYVQPRIAEAVFKRHFEKVMRESRPGARFLNDPTDVCEHGALITDCGVCR